MRHACRPPACLRRARSARGLDAVIDGVAHQVHERIGELLGDQLVDLGLGAADDELHALVLLARRAGARPARACRTPATAGPCARRAPRPAPRPGAARSARCTRCASSTSSARDAPPRSLSSSCRRRCARCRARRPRSSGGRACGCRRAPRWSASAARAASPRRARRRGRARRAGAGRRAASPRRRGCAASAAATRGAAPARAARGARSRAACRRPATSARASSAGRRRAREQQLDADRAVALRAPGSAAATRSRPAAARAA